MSGQKKLTSFFKPLSESEIQNNECDKDKTTRELCVVIDSGKT